MVKIGTRILDAPPPHSPDIVAAYQDIGVAQVSDCMSRLYGMVGLGPMYTPSKTMAGRALTVKTCPGDNLFIHKALLMAHPGDVIVVDAGGDLTNALIGELMMLDARARGVVGLVLDGAVRDAGHLRATPFPVFARGVSHRGPYKNGPGELNVPVAAGGQVVQAGDMVIGDADGLLAIPADQVASVLEEARAKVTAEAETRQRIAEGRNEKPWVDEALGRLGTGR